MHFVRPLFLLKLIYPELVWRKNKAKKNIYLTFDDGPIPEITPWVLDCLKDKQIKATFFCVGENIKKNPQLLERIKNEGHQIGNHTMNHLKGWDTDSRKYLANIQECQNFTGTNLFRPPYGRAKKKQLSDIKQKYQIIMWDVLTGDYNPLITPEQCLKNTIKYCRNGSIIVFHDNIKAIDNLKYALPKAIDTLLAEGYIFSLL